MVALTVIRNVLAALAATALMLLVGHALAPVLRGQLPGADAVAAVLALGTMLLPVVYKLIDGALGAIGFGRRSMPAYARGASIVSGASVLALVWGGFAFVMALFLAQAGPAVKDAAAAEKLLHQISGHLPWIKAGVLMVTALFIGSWVGRRHGRPSLFVLAGVALFGCAAMMAVDVLAGIRSTATFHEAFKAIPSVAKENPKHLVAVFRVLELHVVLAVFFAALVGSLLSGGGGGRRPAGSERLVRPLHLGAD